LIADDKFSKPRSLGYIKRDISGPDGKLIYGTYESMIESNPKGFREFDEN
jgi:hypothetical protein